MKIDASLNMLTLSQAGEKLNPATFNRASPVHLHLNSKPLNPAPLAQSPEPPKLNRNPFRSQRKVGLG